LKERDKGTEAQSKKDKKKQGDEGKEK